jgi:hypothetical protein
MTFPTISGPLLPNRSIKRTQRASPIKAMIELMDWKRRIRLYVKPMVWKIYEGVSTVSSGNRGNMPS